MSCTSCEVIRAHIERAKAAGNAEAVRVHTKLLEGHIKHDHPQPQAVVIWKDQTKWVQR